MSSRFDESSNVLCRQMDDNANDKVRDLLGDPKETISRQQEYLGVHRNPATPNVKPRSDRELFSRVNSASRERTPSQAPSSDRPRQAQSQQDRRWASSTSASSESHRKSRVDAHSEHARSSSSSARQTTSQAQSYHTARSSSLAPSHSQPANRTPESSDAHHRKASSQGRNDSRPSQYDKNTSDNRKSSGAARLLPLKVRPCIIIQAEL